LWSFLVGRTFLEKHKPKCRRKQLKEDMKLRMKTNGVLRHGKLTASLDSLTQFAEFPSDPLSKISANACLLQKLGTGMLELHTKQGDQIVEVEHEELVYASQSVNHFQFVLAVAD